MNGTFSGSLAATLSSATIPTGNGPATSEICPDHHEQVRRRRHEQRDQRGGTAIADGADGRDRVDQVHDRDCGVERGRSGVVDGYSISRDGSFIELVGPGVLQYVDTPGDSDPHSYTVVAISNNCTNCTPDRCGGWQHVGTGRDSRQPGSGRQQLRDGHHLLDGRDG